MASINFNSFNDNWFSKPSKPFQPINLVSLIKPLTFKAPKSPSFASISSSSFPESDDPQKSSNPEPGTHSRLLDQYFWECYNLPDYRHTPEVEKILNEERQTETEKERKEKENCPFARFMARAEEIANETNEMELKKNEHPYRYEDRKLWKEVPHVIGLDGRPMPRKALKTKQEADDTFWDYMQQFLFGRWGFRQRPYPPGRPIDVAQAIGYERLEKRYYDFIMRSGGFYYKDRLGRTRGPAELITLKTAWSAGIIDKDTFVWGEDLDEWAPIHMIYGMERAIATWEVRFGAAATEFLHKLQKGIPPWVPLKGREKKTYKQQQEEAMESKRRDMAVLKANGGVWPGVRTPSYALFLWASGSQLTSILEEDHMPNKYIPKELRLQLAKVIPGLRPWEVLSVEQAMDQITYGGKWYRQPLGTFTTGPPYIQHWNKDVMSLLNIFTKLSAQVYKKLESSIPGFSTVVEKAQADADARAAMRKEKRDARKRNRGMGL